MGNWYHGRGNHSLGDFCMSLHCTWSATLPVRDVPVSALLHWHPWAAAFSFLYSSSTWPVRWTGRMTSESPKNLLLTKSQSFVNNHLFSLTKYVSNARSGLVPVDTNKMPCPLAVGHPIGEEMKPKQDYGTVKNEYSKECSDTDKRGLESDDKNNFLWHFCVFMLGKVLIIFFI